MKLWGASSSLTNQLQRDRMITNPRDHPDESAQSADESIYPSQERTAHADTQRKTAILFSSKKSRTSLRHRCGSA